MNPFGDAVRQLMEAKKVSGLKLAEFIGITPTSVSRILNGQSRPRQVTLTRIVKRLCETPEEEQLLVRAYTGLVDSMPDEPDKPIRPIPEDEIERVTCYMEVKSMSVAFEHDVEAVIKEANLGYEKDFRVDPFICDFMLLLPACRVAIDCKYNVNRDWDRTFATVKLLKENLPCDEVVIAIPYENDLARKAHKEIESVGGRILNILYLIEQGLLELPVLYLSRYLIQHKNDYYHRLLEISTRQAWEPWVLYMLKGIEETATSTREMVQAIRQLLEETLEKVRTDLPKIYSKELVELLFHQPYTKIAFLVDAGIAKRQTAATYLQSMEAIGVLTSEAVGRERLFINTALLELLKKGNA